MKLEEFAARGAAAQEAVDHIIRTAHEFATRGDAAEVTQSSQAEIDLYTNRWRFHPSMRCEAGELLQLVLYNKPADYPELFVVRPWFIRSGGVRSGPVLGFQMEATALAWIGQEFPDLVRISASPDDDPKIVAVWT